MTTPYQKVTERYSFPFVAKDWQEKIINNLAILDRSGCYAEVGTGKTFMGTAVALFKKMTAGKSTIVVMPPILIPGWCRWLAKIEGITVTDLCFRVHVSFSLSIEESQFDQRDTSTGQLLQESSVDYLGSRCKYWY